MSFSYNDTDKMSDVIASQPSLLQMICRFGIQLGVGDKTVREVCEDSGVDTVTFLAVANFMKNGKSVAPFYIDKLDIKTLIRHLKTAHDFFLNFQLAHIRRKLLDAIDCSQQNEVAFLILKFYDEFLAEVRRHMDYENKRVFTCVDQLLAGHRPAEPLAPHSTKSHEGIDRKLAELKNIIIKYYTPTDAQSSDLLCNVLFSLYTCGTDLHMHCEMEDTLFIPAVRILEEKVSAGLPPADEQQEDAGPQESLSEREKEIVACIVRGMTNKEVAAQLFISVNTVLTHRKNISRKLDIHSVSGLTIYAIVNGIVKLDEVK